MKKLVINEISCISGGANKINMLNRIFIGINIITIPVVIAANYLAAKNQKEIEKQNKYKAWQYKNIKKLDYFANNARNDNVE